MPRALLLLGLAFLLAGCGGARAVATAQTKPSFAAAERVGFDPALLRAADRRFAATPGLVSVLAMRHGRLAFERYYHGADGSVARNVFSVTKSVTSALVGIALQRGDLRGLDDRLVRFFPDKLEHGADPRVSSITLRDLLTMSAGYRQSAVYSTDDWVRTLLNRRLETDPGTAFSYDDGSAHLLSAVLTKATGKSAAELARDELFAPLGIRRGRWITDGHGNSLGSTGLILRSRDLLKVGQLYLQRGRWAGRQIVPAAWIRESTRTQIRIPGGYAYGYLWWINTGPHGGFVALGYAGQTIAVYPRLDLVLVTTGGGTFDPLAVIRRLLNAVVR